MNLRYLWSKALVVAAFAVLLLSSIASANVRLVFDSTSLDFGSVAVLGAKDLTLDVLDTSSSDIEIDAITPIGSNAGDFKILSPATPVVVTAGQKIPTQIIIQFSPMAVGTRTSSLSLETSDGEVLIPMTGTGAGNESSLKWSSSTVNFGTIAPYGHRDSTIELYSDGTDTALISELEIAAADTSFSASVVKGPQLPLKLAPGDSVQVQIALQGLPPAGSKFAQLSAIGSTENTPACNLTATVQYAGFALEPNIIDFGTMYDGEVRDTTVFLIDTSTLDLDFETLNLSPDGEDFSIKNPIAVPFTLHAGDTLPIIIRANPGVGLLSSSQLLAVSPSAAVRLGTINLTLSASRPHISGPRFDSLLYYCANESNLGDSLDVTNSDTQSIVITGLAFSDTSVVVHARTALPDTIPASTVKNVSFVFNAASATSDTLELELMGGNQILWSDTLALKPTLAEAAPTITMATGNSTNGAATIGTDISLQPFGLDSIIIHLRSTDSNSALIDPASIRLDSTVSHDTIISIEPEPGGYRIVIVSDSQFAASVGSPLLDFGFQQYITSSDSSSIEASVETPERAGCISWTMGTLDIGSGTECGAPILRNALANRPIIVDARLEENPVMGNQANLQINASTGEEVRFEICNALGEIVTSGSLALKAGRNDCSIPIFVVPSGSYTIDIRSTNGCTTVIPFIDLR